MTVRGITVALTLIACGNGSSSDRSTSGGGSGASGSSVSVSGSSESGGDISARGGDISTSTGSSGGGTGGGGTGSGGGSDSVGGGASATGSGSIGSGAPVEVPDPADATLGANIALAVLGGHVVRPADGEDRSLRASNLIDGFPVIRDMELVSRGWQSQAVTFPQDIVLAFHGGAQATISTVVVDTAAEGNLLDTAGVPKDVQVLVSTTSATAGFAAVASATLPVTAGETALRFPPVAARWVKLSIGSTHGGAPPMIGELAVYESGTAASVIAGVPKNLLLPALGGNLVRFTSQASDMFAARLVDGETSDVEGWSSAPGPVEAPAQLPQELVFAFRDQRSAFIDRVVIDPTSGMRFYAGPRPNVTTWPRSVEVMISDAPSTAFTSLGVIAIPPVARPVVVKVGKSLRFLKLRVLEIHGGDRVTMGEVSAFEGTPPEGRSLTAGRRRPLVRAGTAATARGTETSTRKEREPNDAPATADPLEPAAIVGGITSEADRDVFAVAGAGGPGQQSLTIGLEGQPAIGARVAVRDGRGATLLALDPSRLTTGARTRLSVVAPAGKLFVELVQPPSAQVVIWDTSGSMERRVADLDAALRQYLAQVKPSDRVQLIRFDDTIDVLMKDLSNQPAGLLAALTDKVYANGGTAIYDAIGKGLEVLAPVAGNRVIVLMTDGEDTSSTLDPSQLATALDAAHTRIYTIGLGNGLRSHVARAGATAERVLANIAETTGGRYVYVADSSQLHRLYAEIAAELHAPATYAISARTSSARGTLSVEALGDRLAVPPRVELVLDASGSMKRAIAGKSMMDSAKAALSDVVARLPAGTRVALRVYGQRIPEGRDGACEDSQLAVPFGPLDRKALISTVKAVRALGTTPIAYSIQRAGEDLRETPGPAMLIVVTDGREECKGDPAAEVAKLRASGLDITLNIVGFSLSDAGDRATMVKLAAAGNGTYFDARDEAALRGAIDRALAVPYVVVDAAGAIVGRGIVGGPAIELPAGELAVRLESAGAPIVIEHVPVAAGKRSLVELTKDGDRVGVRIAAPPTQEGSP